MLDVGLIQRSQKDFARLVGILPLDDQEDLFHVLVRDTEIWRLKSCAEDRPDENGVFTSKVRGRWYRVKATLYQLPGIELGRLRAVKSSDLEESGSPTRIRTSNLAVNSRPLYR